MSMTENQIREKLNRGDLDVFQYLYKEFYPSLCIYAKSITRDKEIAQEVVQDVFIRLWEQQGHLKEIISIKSYLYFSVRNHCLNHLKHLQVVNKFNEYYSQKLKDAQDYYFITQESGESLLIANELEEKVLKEIESLPEQCRKILKMSRFEGLKHSEIASNLGIAISTVHSQISIALEKLRAACKANLIILLLLIRFYIY